MSKETRTLLCFAALLFIGSCAFNGRGLYGVSPHPVVQRFLPQLERDIAAEPVEERRLRMQNALRLVTVGHESDLQDAHRAYSTLFICGGILAVGVLIATVRIILRDC